MSRCGNRYKDGSRRWALQRWRRYPMPFFGLGTPCSRQEPFSSRQMRRRLAPLRRPSPALCMDSTGNYSIYPTSWQWLPIAVLEFLAVAVSIIIFTPLLDHAPSVVLQTDSITTAFALANDAASSPLMIAAHSLLLRSPEYTRLLAGLTEWREVTVQHIYGDTNIAADYLSRGQALRFQTFCINMDIRSTRLRVPPAASAYLQGFFRSVHPFIPPELLARGRSPAAVDYDGPLIAPRLTYRVFPVLPPADILPSSARRSLPSPASLPPICALALISHTSVPPCRRPTLSGSNASAVLFASPPSSSQPFGAYGGRFPLSS